MLPKVVCAIKEIGTDRFMPDSAGGHTWIESVMGCMPRLFKSERAAKLSIIAWKKGHAKQLIVNTWSPIIGDTVVLGGVEFSEVVGRKERNLKVVSLVISEL